MAETKDVTRRLGWWFLKAGDKVQLVEKGMGLKKGEKVKRLRLVEIVSTRREPLNAITQAECVREGFPDMTPAEFVGMFCRHNKCDKYVQVNRIEWRYL